MKNDALIIDDLHHKYDKRECSNWILNEINLKIENGELLGLLGPSGCGKTTLLRLIAGFEYPSKGTISLNYKEKPVLGLANFPILNKYYFNTSKKSAYVSEKGKKRKIKVSKKTSFSNLKVSVAFNGGLPLNKQKKIPQILKMMR